MNVWLKCTEKLWGPCAKLFYLENMGLKTSLITSNKLQENFSTTNQPCYTIFMSSFHLHFVHLFDAYKLKIKVITPFKENLLVICHVNYTKNSARSQSGWNSSPRKTKTMVKLANNHYLFWFNVLYWFTVFSGNIYWSDVIQCKLSCFLRFTFSLLS